VADADGDDDGDEEAKAEGEGEATVEGGGLEGGRVGGSLSARPWWARGDGLAAEGEGDETGAWGRSELGGEATATAVAQMGMSLGHHGPARAG